MGERGAVSDLAGALTQYTDEDLRLLAERLGVTSAPADRDGLLAAVSDASSALAAGLVVAADSRAAAMVGGGGIVMTDLDRVATTMDEIRRDVIRLTTDVEVVKTRLSDMDTRLRTIEPDMRPAPTWQTWLMLIAGLLMTVVTIAALLRLGAG